MPILWNDEFNVGIKIIDEQHRYFVSVLNKVIDVVGLSKSKGEIDEIFQEIERYSSIHFSTEEEYFKKFNYEGAEKHIEQHDKFKEKIKEIRRQYYNDQITSSFNLADFLEDWLLKHLDGMDKKYVECFHSHGLY